MNVTDKLYSEWAWRSKTGVPDINNPEDKVILDNLIAELSGEKNLSGKEKLIQLINSTSLSDDQIERIERGIVNIGFKDDIFLLLKNKGFKEDSFKSKGALETIFHQLAETDLSTVVQYLRKPVKLPSGKHNVKTLTGLPDNIIHSIFRIEPGLDSAGSTIGPGEIGLGLLFSNINNRTGGGDLSWNGENLEVKKNGGRFGLQGGRTSSVNVLKYLIRDILKKEDQEEFIKDPSNEIMTYALANLAKLAQQEKANIDQVISEVQSVLDEMYSNKGYASSFISKENITDPDKLKKAILKISMHSYMDKNNIDAVLFWNPNSLDYFTFEKKDIDSIVDQRLIDTSQAKKTNPALGFKWNNPFPQLYFL